MSRQQPPRFASWLLTRFASGPKADSLIGDLTEEYRAGRSSVWYWRQVRNAVLVGAARDARERKLLALRAVATGWLFYILFSFPVNRLSVAARRSIEGWLADSGRYSEWGVFWAGQLPATLFVYLACAISGWIVARFHARHAAVMVLLYAASVFLFEYGVMAIGFASAGHPPMPVAMLILPAALAIGRPISILIGGLLATRSERDRSAVA